MPRRSDSMHYGIALIAACAVHVAPITAQTTPLSRSEAIRIALERGALLAVARADTAAATAAVVAAHAIPNPTLAASYSKSVPTHHVALEIPFEYPGIRSLRVRAAALGRQAADYREQFVRATVALDADTTYTRSLAARDHLALSRRNALDADSVLHMVMRRRDAGDASDMDVELARVTAGQQTNLFVGDSLTLISTLLDLQAVLGMNEAGLRIRVTDSLGLPPGATEPRRKTISEEAAFLSLESASLTAKLQRRSVWSTPSVSLGFEHGDPDQRGLLPTFGLGIGLPLFNRNKGAIAEADAAREKASAELTLAQVEAKNQTAHANRQRELALARVVRGQQIVVSAERVAAMSLVAYREGASTLASILEARRTAREVLGQYIDDLASAWIATAELRALAVVPQASPD